MFIRTTTVVLSAFALAAVALEKRGAEVLTAERIYHTVIDESPFLVDRTTTIVWTQSPSIIETETATPGPSPSPY
ncbi:hypothetical protein BDZ94DRAFT_1310898 [Collybia nuda]|uniref:Uncharacterized protein n=1 Tax=Collybia nuda TaxID=64659 RepID=A0A9P5Y0S3_9AGAR|nr:hypothetical protein BDZ94DRAFT_1310898 [Collybia nuda]